MDSSSCILLVYLYVEDRVASFPENELQYMQMKVIMSGFVLIYYEDYFVAITFS